MNVLGCTSVAVIRVEMTVGRTRPEGRELKVSETEDGKEGFAIWVPRRLEDKIRIGDTLVVLCIPNPHLFDASETMAVAKKEGLRMTAIIYSRSSFWLEKFTSLFPGHH